VKRRTVEAPDHVNVHGAAAALAVSCKGCGVTEWAYVVYVRTIEPGWVDRMIAHHSGCAPRAAANG
jgi:sarcosine oxidase delta subunit